MADPRRRTPVLLRFGLVLVAGALSSILGLSGALAVSSSGNPAALGLLRIWRASVWADLAFAVGTVLALHAAILVAGWNKAVGAVVSLLANWGVYSLSWHLSGEWGPMVGDSPFVPLVFGSVGLLWCAFAPLAILGVERRALRPPSKPGLSRPS